MYNAGVYCSKFLSNAWVAKSVDAADSKSAGETRVGSSPTLGTNIFPLNYKILSFITNLKSVT